MSTPVSPASPPVVVVLAPARLDGLTAEPFGNFVLGLVNAGSTRLILDFSQVRYLGSAGVRVLLLVHRALAARSGHLVLAGCWTAVLEVLRLCGLSDQFVFAEHIEGARDRL